MAIPIFDRGELVDLGSKRTFLLPGDLVELLATGSRQQELAIFVRHLDYQSQFYTMSGRWVHRTDKHPLFYVPAFVEAHELESIKEYLPQEAVPMELEDRLHSFEIVPPRIVGSPLTLKMTKFWADSDAAYQKAASRFDNVHRIVAHATRFTYATLEEIAHRALSGFVPKTNDGNFSPAVLYALHRSMLRDDIGFRAQPGKAMRAGGEYEINSIGEVNSINQVTQFVRSYREQLVMNPESLLTHPLTRFAHDARKLIAASRQIRQYTRYGVIGPYSGAENVEGHFRYGHSHKPFLSHMTPFLRFLESWSCLESFSRYSSLNGVGSTILRAIGTYDDVPLDKKTAFTALQELGAIAPWENRAAYELRLPYTGRRLAPGLFTHKFSDPDKEIVFRDAGERPDVLKDLRKDWGDVTVYCIDDATAQELDDGISVECTENPEEFWVHIHTADPSSHLDPQGRASTIAELLTENIYLEDRTVPMLSSEFIKTEHSLAPGRQCLTFSARMNLNGEVLESAITPGIVRNVVNMTYEVLKEVTSGMQSSKSISYVVGSNEAVAEPARPLVGIDQLSDVHKHELMLLERIQHGRWKYLGDRGGAFKRPPKSSMSVSFGGAAWEKAPQNDSLHYHGDPTIRLSFDETHDPNDLGLVACFMLVASEVAGRWCSARGIPVPYRVTPLDPERDPADYFTNVYLPARDESGEIPLEIQMEYTRQIPAVQLSTTPGRHVALGMDMVARCTSPLRRFSDLLAHWQIGATLFEEHRLGHSLVGNTSEDFLPFSRARIDALLPRLALREKLISLGSAHASRSWAIMFLVRAWHFKQAELPRLIFSVRSVNPDTRQCGGVIESLLVGAQMSIPSGMDPEELKVEDKFEVEIADLDVWGLKISVDMVRRVES
ncbi:RNB-domain-containing protein [Stipitochalara longipes BDJ]|nr:RNB-domain-containing protein [Stipitochalara longipes BDJ]